MKKNGKIRWTSLIRLHHKNCCSPKFVDISTVHIPSIYLRKYKKSFWLSRMGREPWVHVLILKLIYISSCRVFSRLVFPSAHCDFFFQCNDRKGELWCFIEHFLFDKRLFYVVKKTPCKASHCCIVYSHKIYRGKIDRQRDR